VASHTYVPPQHGAWAFLGLPVLLALAVSPWTPLVLLLALAWVAAYPASYALLGLTRSRRPQRFRRMLAVWAVPLVPAALVLVVARPWLLWAGLAYVVLFAVNLVHARRNAERALLNDLVFVVECAAMVPLTWAVASGTPSWTPPAPVPEQVWVLAVLCALVLCGSTLHVKAHLRERRDPRYRRASRAVALGSLVAAVGLALRWGLPSGWWLLLPFVLLAVRAWLPPPARPARLGLLELVPFVAAVLAAVLASR
jgi:hypothetical protein